MNALKNSLNHIDWSELIEHNAPDKSMTNSRNRALYSDKDIQCKS